MSVVYSLEQNKEYKIGKETVHKLFIAVCTKATVFDELWMILDYCFIGLLFYLNGQYIKSGLFGFALFIWLMVMIFFYPREKNERILNKEEFLEKFEKMWTEYEKDNK